MELVAREARGRSANAGFGLDGLDFEYLALGLRLGAGVEIFRIRWPSSVSVRSETSLTEVDVGRSS